MNIIIEKEKYNDTWLAILEVIKRFDADPAVKAALIQRKNWHEMYNYFTAIETEVKNNIRVKEMVQQNKLLEIENDSN